MLLSRKLPIAAAVLIAAVSTIVAFSAAGSTGLPTAATISGLAMLLLGAVAIGLFWFSRFVTRPLAAMAVNMRRLAEGDTGFDLAGESRNDAIGELARSLAACRDVVREKISLQRQAEESRSVIERDAQQRDSAKAEDARHRQQAVDALAGGLRQLTKGNLDCRLDRPFIQELDSLRIDFNALVERLSGTLAVVNENILAIKNDTAELRSATDDLSTRTSSQAAWLEEASAALDQITATVTNTSERADEATSKASEAKLSTDKSGKIVNQAIEAMVRIEHASGEISTIINVIDEIAFQTNLLALNAGVEAARAGDAGRGFAVVAYEVRELARRAASSAMEIKELIRKSGEEVKSGVSLVRQTSDALGLIALHVSDINHQINSIAIAAREQASGLSEINAAVNQMDCMTQQNAAMVEQTNEVTLRLASGAASLQGLTFRFAQPGAPAAAVPAQPPQAPMPGRITLSGGRSWGPGAATAASQPAASPARQLVKSVARAFGAASPAGASPQSQDDWEEF